MCSGWSFGGEDENFGNAAIDDVHGMDVLVLMFGDGMSV